MKLERPRYVWDKKQHAFVCSECGKMPFPHKERDIFPAFCIHCNADMRRKEVKEMKKVFKDIMNSAPAELKNYMRELCATLGADMDYTGSDGGPLTKEEALDIISFIISCAKA